MLIYTDFTTGKPRLTYDEAAADGVSDQEVLLEREATLASCVSPLHKEDFEEPTGADIKDNDDDEDGEDSDDYEHSEDSDDDDDDNDDDDGQDMQDDDDNDSAASILNAFSCNVEFMFSGHLVLKRVSRDEDTVDDGDRSVLGYIEDYESI